MRVFIDANVVMDMLLKRKHYKSAQAIFSLAEKGVIRLYISSLTYAIISYHLLKQYNIKDCIEILRILYQNYNTLSFSKEAVKKALYSNFRDIEDGYQYFVAKEYNIPIIITRNTKDFLVDDLSVITPEQFLNMYRKQ